MRVKGQEQRTEGRIFGTKTMDFAFSRVQKWGVN